MAKAKSKPKVNAAALAAKMMGGGGSSPAVKKAPSSPGTKSPVAAKAPAAKAPAPAPAPRPKPAGKPKSNAKGDSGAAEAAAFVAARGLSTAGKARWWLDVELDVVDGPAPPAFALDSATRFHVDIYRDEWSVLFVHKGKRSHVRKTAEQTFAGQDDWKLLGELPALDDVGSLLRSLESKHKIAFKREHAATRSNLAGADAALRAWAADL